MERDDFTTPCRVCGVRGDTSMCSERCRQALERAHEKAEPIYVRIDGPDAGQALAELQSNIQYDGLDVSLTVSASPIDTSEAERADHRDSRRHERLTGERGREGKY